MSMTHDLLLHRQATPVLLQGFDYWDSKRRGRSMPARADLDPIGIGIGHRAFVAGTQDHAGMQRDVALQPGADHGRFGDQQRHGLPLHVRTHEGPVRIVVLEKRNQAG